jgi:S-adenosylmethionine-diacylglycerol 3-amino-3-carboxypropyl transferase
MGEKLTDKVSFDLIRYANCWEDADILLEGLSPKAGSKILSIASAGDNSFSLLITGPEMVVAVDVNKVQLHLCELKRACIKIFDRALTLQFLGFMECRNRLQLFEELKKELPVETLKYWGKNLQQLKAGIIHQGKFEKYFIIFSKSMLPLIHSPGKSMELFRKKDQEEQKKFYDERWNTWRWRLLFKIFFSRYVMGKLGRDPEFLKEVKVKVSDYIFNKAEKQLKSTAAQENFILRFNLTGSFGDLLPHYLQEGNYEKIKSNIGKLHIREGYAEDVIMEFGSFDCMNLSNIFEYMHKDIFYKTVGQLLKGLNKGGRLAYWNLMVPRRISGVFPEVMQYKKELSLDLSERDKGFFYNQFIVDEKL